MRPYHLGIHVHIISVLDLLFTVFAAAPPKNPPIVRLKTGRLSNHPWPGSHHHRPTPGSRLTTQFS